ncbi:MAG: hypothetical protein IPM74_03600 [Crocinitomicaceae bacterium]|nr:hypothetical protein [Crocinitomicaceae bacterium]
MPAEEDVKKPQRYVDVHEYYWANLTEEKISVGEITDWLRETLKGAKQTYNKKLERNEESSKDEHIDNRKASLSQLANMLRRIIFWYNIVKATAIIGVIIGAALQVLTNLFSPATKIVKGIWKKFENSASAMLKGYVGDVAIYTTMDVKKKHYELREKILAGARQQIEALIKSDKYDEIIIAGHSLGSAIAYDALNKLSIRISLDGEDDLRNSCAKLKGLVTFGSPLDKIYFFFKQTTGKK